MKLHLTAAGLAVGLVAGSAAGLVLVPVSAVGQTTAPTSPPAGGDATVERARVMHFRDALAPLVTDGTLTQAQADKVVATLEAVAPAHGPARHRFHVDLDVVATTLGMTQSALHEALRAGQSIAEVARSKGIAPQRVIDALVGEAKKRLDEKVASGGITQAQASTRLAEARRMITALVNGELAGPGAHRGPRRVTAPTDTTPAGTASSTA